MNNQGFNTFIIFIFIFVLASLVTVCKYNGSPKIVTPKIDAFLKISRNFWNPKKFPTGPSWTPKLSKSHQFWWPKKITQCAGPQKSYRNEFWNVFLKNEILLFQNFNFWTKKFREISVENWHAKDWHISEVSYCISYIV